MAQSPFLLMPSGMATDIVAFRAAKEAILSRSEPCGVSFPLAESNIRKLEAYATINSQSRSEISRYAIASGSRGETAG